MLEFETEDLESYKILNREGGEKQSTQLRRNKIKEKPLNECEEINKVVRKICRAAVRNPSSELLGVSHHPKGTFPPSP